MKQKRGCWLVSLVVMIFFLLPISVNAVEEVPDVSGSVWDDYVMNHKQEFEKKEVQAEPESFSVQEIMLTKGIPAKDESKSLQTASLKARYTVLAIDTSGSMSGTPMQTAKGAADKFIQQILKEQGENYVAVVGFSDYAKTYSEFTNDSEKLKKAITQLYSSGGTATDQALLRAEELLKKVNTEEAIKNIVVLSDGEPNSENRALDVAERLKEDAHYIYSLGFFHNLSGTSLTRARTFMDRLQNAGYYDVTSSDELEFEFGKIADDITSRSNIFKYPSSDEKLKNSDASAVYYYKDNYFKKSAYEYNEQLATMSLSLALSAFGSTDVGSDYQNKSNNAKNLLKEIGFTDIKTNNWFTKKPEKDSVGAIAGKKKITENGKNYILIALAVRGGGYESEWASNFTLGKSDYHQGFSEARDQVLQFLTKEYIEANGISGDIKLTGFSHIHQQK